MNNQYLTVAAGLIVATALAACSSSGGGTTGSGKSGTSTGPSGSPLVFGVIATQSGPAVSKNSDVSTTISRWQDYVNSHGGVNDHPVKVIVKDDGGSAAQGLQAAQELIQQDHAIAIGDASTADSAFEKYVDSAKVPVIGLTAGNGSFAYMTDANYFTNIYTIQGTIWAGPKLAQLAGAKHYGFMYCSEVAACADAVPYEKQDAKAVGIDFPYVGSFSASAPSYTSYCLAAKEKGVDALYIASVNKSATQRIYDTCAVQGYHPIALGSSLGNAAVTDSKIPAQWASSGTIPWFADTPANSTFRKVMGNYLDKAVQPIVVSEVWVAMQEFAAAAKTGIAASATPSGDGIYTGLYAFDGETLGGMTGPLTFKKGQPNQSQCFFVYAVLHGKYTMPKGMTPVCATGAALQK